MTRERYLQTGALYLIAVFLLTFYGIEVCPFLESLRPVELGSIITGAFLISFILRFLLFRRLDSRERPSPGEADIRRPWLYLRLDLALWIFTGLLVTAWNSLQYDFPVASGLKVVLGCATLGIFSSTYMALDLEHRLVLRLAGEGNIKDLRKGPFLSISTKFLIFIGISLAVITAVILLLVYKDFQFVIDALTGNKPFRFSWVVREIVFVFAILLVGCAILARQYSRNLKLMFELQLKIYEAVARGDYNAFVPVVSHDEFSIIAEGSNQMINGMREKLRIEKAFGKYMSPQIADVILKSEKETGLGGRQVDVAVLFTDLRKFTELSEKRRPREVVNILNEFFTMVVKAIHRRNGVLDKFMGDAAMGVFGLDGCDNPCDDAVEAALDIIDGIAGLNARYEAKGFPLIRNGIGIHYGPVIAGNIGSLERLEYTVIGDTVNTASRLESLTKEISSPIAVSSEVRDRVGADKRVRLSYLGDFMLRGKTESRPVYGLAASSGK